MKAEEKHNPKICKQPKFKLSGMVLTCSGPSFAFHLPNKLPLQMVLVIIGPRREKHDPNICKETKFELSGTFLASPRPVFAFHLPRHIFLTLGQIDIRRSDPVRTLG